MTFDLCCLSAGPIPSNGLCLHVHSAVTGELTGIWLQPFKMAGSSCRGRGAGGLVTTLLLADNQPLSVDKHPLP